jgi:uncharacterized membrane protein
MLPAPTQGGPAARAVGTCASMWMWLSAVLVLAGMAVYITGRMASQGTLRRNYFVGIRTRTTMASDEAWAAAHRAGGRWMAAAGFVMIVGAALLLVNRPGATGSSEIVGATAVVMGVPLVIGALKGQRAAKAAGGSPSRK